MITLDASPGPAGELPGRRRRERVEHAGSSTRSSLRCATAISPDCSPERVHHVDVAPPTSRPRRPKRDVDYG
jgi:hypothetical protein